MATRYRKCKNIFTEQWPETAYLYISYNTVNSVIVIYDEQFKRLDWYSSFWDDAADEGWGDTNNTAFHYKLDEYLMPIYEGYDSQYFVSEEEEKKFPSPYK